MPARPINGYVIALLSSLFFAATSPLVKLLQVTYRVPSLPLALWREIICMAVIGMSIMILRPQLFRVSRAMLLRLLVAGFLGVGGFHLFWTLSIGFNGVALAVVMVYLYTTFSSIALAVLYRNPVTRWQVLALLLSTIGCVLAVKAYDLDVLRLSWLGLLIGLGSALMQTGYVVGTQRAVQSVNIWTSLFYLFLGASVALLLVNVVVAAGEIAAVPGWQAWVLIALLATIPTIGGYAFFNLGMRYLPGNVVGLIGVTELVWASAISYFLNGETLQPVQVFGCALVLLSTVLANLGSKSQTAPA